jgi:hypothetical protein
MAIKSQVQLLASISGDLADNQFGAITAAKVRGNLSDIVESITTIVGSGDFKDTTPFTNDVRIKHTAGVGGGTLYTSGIKFDNYPGDVQVRPYLGSEDIDHNSLDKLDEGHPHPQYVLGNGTVVMSGNFGLGTRWINSSGLQNGTSDNRGLKFQFVTPQSENVIVGTGTQFVFDRDSSKLPTSKGVAKAWINFNASGVNISVRDSYNIHQIERARTGGVASAGKFIVTFASGTFANNNYVVCANSNCQGDNDSGEEFTNNTVGVVYRSGNDGTSLRTLTFQVRANDQTAVDAAVNDLVIFGRSPGESSGVQPIIVLG